MLYILKGAVGEGRVTFYRKYKYKKRFKYLFLNREPIHWHRHSQNPVTLAYLIFFLFGTGNYAGTDIFKSQ